MIEAALKHKKLKNNRLVVGGKSMGGRIASQVIAGEEKESFIDEVAGLVFLGYPLHPPGQSTKLRVEHLEHVGKPMLFVQGTRDALGTPEEIQPSHQRSSTCCEDLFRSKAAIIRSRRRRNLVSPQEQIYEAAMNEIDRWARSHLS